MSFEKNKKFIPNWPNNHAPQQHQIKHNHPSKSESTNSPASVHEESLDLVSTNDLQQGELYIIKIKLIAIALFQGWDDEMCCFSILRTDLLDELRWSEARYLPENFDAYLAFDYAGNPPIHLWTKQLRAIIPFNWFNIFEEARHMQRQWNLSFWHPQQHHHLQEEGNLIMNGGGADVAITGYDLTDVPDVPSHEAMDHQAEAQKEGEMQQEQQEQQDQPEQSEHYDENEYYNQQEETVIGGNEGNYKYYSALPPQQQQKQQQQQRQAAITHLIKNESASNTAGTPAMQLQNQYMVTQHQQQQQQQKRDAAVEQQTNRSKVIQDIFKGQEEQEEEQDATPKRPELKERRRSFSSFFLKKKKSKKSLNSNISEDDKRKSAPSTPIINEKYHKRKSLVPESSTSNKSKVTVERKPIVLDKIPTTPKDLPALVPSSSNNKDNERPTPSSSASSPSTTVKTPKNGSSTNTDKNNKRFEGFDDIDSYFDMQATFAFLDSSSNAAAENSSLNTNKKQSLTITN